MFDTLKIFIETNQKLKSEFLEYLRDIIEKETGEIRKVLKYKNFTITETKNGFKILGSIHKFILGNNLNDNSRELTKQAIQQIEKELGIDLMNGIVRRLDFSTNIFTKEPPAKYFSLFGDLSRYKYTFIQDQTLYYNTRNKQLVLYDKVTEYQNNQSKLLKRSPKSIELPEYLRGKNIFRIEMRFIKDLKKEFGKVIYCKDLIEPDFYNTLKGKLKETFLSIKRSKDLIMNSNIEFNDPKEFRDIIFLNGIFKMFGDLGNSIKYIKTLLRTGKLTRNQYNELRKKLLKLEQLPVIKENELINEIDTKFKRQIAMNK